MRPVARRPLCRVRAPDGTGSAPSRTNGSWTGRARRARSSASARSRRRCAESAPPDEHPRRAEHDRARREVGDVDPDQVDVRPRGEGAVARPWRAGCAAVDAPRLSVAVPFRRRPTQASIALTRLAEPPARRCREGRSRSSARPSCRCWCRCSKRPCCDSPRRARRARCRRPPCLEEAFRRGVTRTPDRRRTRPGPPRRRP